MYLYTYVAIYVCTYMHRTDNHLTMFLFVFIVINAQLPPDNPDAINDIMFPENFHTHIVIPANAIIYQRNIEGKITELLLVLMLCISLFTLKICHCFKNKLIYIRILISKNQALYVL